MTELNLPKAPLRVEERDGMTCVFDPLRRRWVALTPEEWVRQNFVFFLIAAKGYPAGLIGNEIALRLNNTSRRCDTVIYTTSGAPWMIVEYKAPHIPINQAVLEQILRYNIVAKAPYLTLSNGMTTYCCEIDAATGRHRFLEDLPPYPFTP